MAKVHRDAIRRIDFEEMVDAFAEDAAFQALAQRIGREDVGHLLEEVAGVLLAFHAHAQFTKTVDPAPYGRTRHAYLAGDARSADDNRCVFGEQVQQRSNAAVGRSWGRLLGDALSHERGKCKPESREKPTLN